MIADSFAIGKMSGCSTIEMVNLTRNSWFCGLRCFDGIVKKRI